MTEMEMIKMLTNIVHMDMIIKVIINVIDMDMNKRIIKTAMSIEIL